MSVEDEEEEDEEKEEGEEEGEEGGGVEGGRRRRRRRGRKGERCMAGWGPSPRQQSPCLHVQPEVLIKTHPWHSHLEGFVCVCLCHSV